VALAKPYFQFPEEDDTPAFVWKGMELSLQACSQLEARAGRVRSAMERALRLVRFGSRVQKGEGPLVSWLFGSQYIHTGIREIEKLIRESRLSVEELRICLTVLELAPDPREELREAMLVEYQRFSALVDSLARGENPGRLPKGWQSFAYRKPLLKAQRMKRRAAEDARRIRALACWPARGRRSAGPRPDFWAKLSLDDLAHDTLWLGEYLDEWLGFADDEVFALSAVRVLAALALHRETHGRLPDSLDELVPEYLREVPRDPYDGNPLRYLPDQGMVYAIGPDLVDRGGLPLTGRGEPDPCFRLDG
jgi:hypothetical protein